VTLAAAEPSQQPRRCVLSLGSNLGDRLDNLQQAVDALLEAPGLVALSLSPVYETAPVGGPDQPDFLNAVLVVDTVLSGRVLLERAQALEHAMGRVRGEYHGPRVIDVDLVHLDGEETREDDLVLPHARAHERAFVLAPWLDVDADAELPGRGRVRDLLDRVGLDGVDRRDDMALRLPL